MSTLRSFLFVPFSCHVAISIPVKSCLPSLQNNFSDKTHQTPDITRWWSRRVEKWGANTIFVKHYSNHSAYILQPSPLCLFYPIQTVSSLGHGFLEELGPWQTSPLFTKSERGTFSTCLFHVNIQQLIHIQNPNPYKNTKTNQSVVHLRASISRCNKQLMWKMGGPPPPYRL